MIIVHDDNVLVANIGRVGMMKGCLRVELFLRCRLVSLNKVDLLVSNRPLPIRFWFGSDLLRAIMITSVFLL